MAVGAYRKRLVYRAAPDIIRYGATSTVTASIAAAAIVFGGSAAAVPPAATDGGTASGAITFAGGPITTITLEVSGASPVAFGGSANGYGFVSRTASAGIVLAGVATAQPFAASSIVFSGTATAAGSFFTAEVAAPIVFGGTAAPLLTSPAEGAAVGAIVFGGAIDQAGIGGITYTADAADVIVFAGGAIGTALLIEGQTASDAIVFGGAAIGATSNQVVTIRKKVKKYEFRVTRT